MGKIDPAHPAFNVHPIGPLKRWVCTYRRAGRPCGVVLLGTDPETVLAINAGFLTGLVVEGELLGEIPVDDEEAQRMIDEYERAKG